MAKTKHYRKCKKHRNVFNTKSNNCSTTTSVKFYYTYYKGWCEYGPFPPLFQTPSSAILWQTYLLFKDGYNTVFQDNLPLVFGTVGVIEVSSNVILNGITYDECLLKQIGICNDTEHDNTTTSALIQRGRKSMVTIAYFSKLIWYSITNDSFFSFITKRYLKQIPKGIYNHVQTYFSTPDFLSSSNSILSKKINIPLSLYNIDPKKLYDIHSGVSVPRCYDNYGFPVCNAYSIKQSLKAISNTDKNHSTSVSSTSSKKTTLTLDQSTVCGLANKHGRMIQIYHCRRIIISIGSGNGATELSCCERGDYIICVDICKRDLCTGIFSARLKLKELEDQHSRVVFHHFDLKNISIMMQFVVLLEAKTKVQPIILFQHPTPSISFVEETLTPAVNCLLDLVFDWHIKKIIFVYDSLMHSEQEQENMNITNDNHGIQRSQKNYFTQQRIMSIVYNYDNKYHSKLLIGNECNLSRCGEEETFHPLFRHHKRKGWSQMKNKEEYCFSISRK